MEINKTEAMLKAICQHLGLTQTANAWAAGENNGGRYVALFHMRLQYRVGVVYEEQFSKLPDFIQNQVDDKVAAGDVSNERERAAKAGVLNECPLFGFTRYQVGKAGDDDKVRWRFGDVLWVSGQRPAQRSTPPAPPSGPEFSLSDVPSIDPGQDDAPFDPDEPPILENKEDFYRWAARMVNAWDYHTAKDKFVAMYHERKDDGLDVGLQSMRAKWLEYVRKARAAEQAFQ